MTRPTLSAVLVNYNHAQYLPQALEAVLNQSVPFDEIVIIDDASTDNSAEIISSRISGLPNARLLQNPVNQGVIATLNIGVRAASGDFIYIFSADDRYSLRIAECWHQAISEFPDVAMVSGNIMVCNSDSGKQRAFALPFPQRLERHDRNALAEIMQKRAFTFYGGGNIIRRDALVEAGMHVPELKWHADWFLYLIVASRYPFAVVPEEFIQIRQSAEQYSHACYDWKEQKPVIESFIRILQKDYADAYPLFRSGALLPTYDLKTLFLLLSHSELRHYLTPLLVWRLLTYKLFRCIGRLIPDSLHSHIRRWLRV